MEMIQCWLNNTLDPNWSAIVQALAEIGHKRLAHKIALNHGMYYCLCVNLKQRMSESNAGGRGREGRPDGRKARGEGEKVRSYDIVLLHWFLQV